MKPRTHRTLLSRVIPAAGLLACFSAASHAAETWNSEDLSNFVDGATIMAAGGGGSPTVADKLLSKYFGASDTVTLTNVSDIVVGKGYTAAADGAIGSPAKLFALTDPLSLPFNAYAGLDLVFNKQTTPISYLMPIEVGTINGLYPFLLAVKLNKLTPSNSVSVLNVDGGGRSVPTLPLLIYSYFPNVYGQQAVVSSPGSVVEQTPPGPYRVGPLDCSRRKPDTDRGYHSVYAERREQPLQRRR